MTRNEIEIISEREEVLEDEMVDGGERGEMVDDEMEEEEGGEMKLSSFYGRKNTSSSLRRRRRGGRRRARGKRSRDMMLGCVLRIFLSFSFLFFFSFFRSG